MQLYALPDEARPPLWRRGTALAAVAGLHAAALLAAFGLAARPDLIPPLQALTVRMLEAEPPRVEAPPPPQIPPQTPPPQPRPAPPRKTAPPPPRKAPAPPPPVLAAAAETAAPASFTVAPQPEAAPVQAPPAPVQAAPTAVAEPVSAARFDADYLQNPKPAYPPLSRRLGEEGKVVLRVRVSAAGEPLAVEIRQSSGHARLDEAARAAVEKWRFVPAKRGSEAIEASVLVPLSFTLNR